MRVIPETERLPFSVITPGSAMCSRKYAQLAVIAAFKDTQIVWSERQA